MSGDQQEYAPGEVITYYLNGWRTGYFISTNGHTIKIQPIAPKAKAVMVPTGDTRVPINR